MLKLRYLNERLKTRFINAKSKNDKSSAWHELSVRFNDRRQLSQTVIQIQKKVEKLVAEYRTIAADEARTGNDVTPEYPEYWPVLAECIRGRKALEGATLAESNWKNLDEEVEVEEGEKEQTKSSSGKGKQNPNLFLADALQTGMTAVAPALAGRGSTDSNKFWQSWKSKTNQPRNSIPLFSKCQES